MFFKEYRIKRKYKKVIQILGDNKLFKRCKSIRTMALAGKDQQAQRMLNQIKSEFGSALSAARVKKDEFTYMMEHFEIWEKNS